MKANCNAELNACDNLQQVLDTLGKYYDLNNTRLNVASRMIVIAGLKQAVKITNAKEK